MIQPTKITKKEFIAALDNTAFIASVFNQPLEKILVAVEEAKELPCIYDVDYVEEKSNHLEIHLVGGGTSRRDFNGKNTYMLFGDLVIHISEQDGHTTTMINL